MVLRGWAARLLACLLAGMRCCFDLTKLGWHWSLGLLDAA